MKRTISLRVYIVTILVVLGIGAAGGVLAYVWFVGGSGDPSRPVQAATLPAQGADDPTAAPTDSPSPEPTADTADTSTDRDARTFTIVQDESEVSFTMAEDLMGVRTTVIGTSNQVAGNILVRFDEPGESMVGPIEINLRTLATNNEFRNRAIRDQILESNRPEYEFTTFTPRAISGLPESVAVGDTFSFTLVGDLPLRHINREVSWDVTVTIVSDDRLEGTATTRVLRSDYELVIPSVPTVANVTNEVDLKIEFVAVAE